MSRSHSESILIDELGSTNTESPQGHFADPLAYEYSVETYDDLARFDVY